MITRFFAEFESVEVAELAAGSIRKNVSGVYNIRFAYNGTADKAEKLRGGRMYKLIPTVSTVHSYNFMTALLEQPASEDVIPEPSRRKNTKLQIICDESSSQQVSSLLHSFGALNVQKNNS